MTTFDLTLFGVGAIVGAGIFSAIGVAIACSFTALAYVIPVSGSAYTYAYATLGEGLAWIIGWDLLLEDAVSNVAIAISWGD